MSINHWTQGRAVIDDLLKRGQLERVSASRELADLMIAQAQTHLESSRLLASVDTAGAFQLAYDAARKALAAILANQGLRAKGAGAHATLYEAVRAQLHPPLGKDLEPFSWMRPLRNDTEYPSLERSVASPDDVTEAGTAASIIIQRASTVLDNMPVY